MRLAAALRKRSADWVLQFVNIVFLLLLYFLISGSISRHPEPGLLLPAAPAVNGMPAGPLVEIAASGTITITGQAVAADALAAGLSNVPRGTPVTVSADKRLKASALIAVLKQLRSLGFERIAVLSAANAP